MTKRNLICGAAVIAAAAAVGCQDKGGNSGGSSPKIDGHVHTSNAPGTTTPDTPTGGSVRQGTGISGHTDLPNNTDGKTNSSSGSSDPSSTPTGGTVPERTGGGGRIDAPASSGRGTSPQSRADAAVGGTVVTGATEGEMDAAGTATAAAARVQPTTRPSAPDAATREADKLGDVEVDVTPSAK